MEWKTSWKCEEITYYKIGTVSDHTQRVNIYNNLDGDKVRVRFSNRLSREAMVFESVTVGVKADGSEEVKNLAPVTVGGKKKIILLPGTEMISDAVSLPVAAGSWLVVSTYVKEANISSVGSTWTRGVLDITECAGKGDQTMEPVVELTDQANVFPEFYAYFPGGAPMVVYGVNGVDVETKANVKEVVLFGDSITHIGHYSTPFTRALYEKYPGKIAVQNCGISGNRLLRDYPVNDFIPEFYSVTFGEAAIKRFERAVFGAGNPDYIMVLLGCNDLIYPYAIGATNEPADASTLQYGYRYLIQTAHAHGSKIALGRMTPYKSPTSEAWTDCLAERNKANKWMEESKADLVIGFDQAVCGEDADRMLAAYDCGDGLHPNVEGGEAMARAVPLEWFA